MQLIHATAHPLPQRLSRLRPSAYLRRPAPPHSSRPERHARARRDRLHIQCRADALHRHPLVSIHQLLDGPSQLAQVVENLQAGPHLGLVQALHPSFQYLHRFGSEFFPGLLDESELLVDDVDAGEVIFLAKGQDLGVELGGLGEIELFGVVEGGEVPELAGEAEGADGMVEKVGGGVEVGELEGFGADGAERIGEVGAGLAEGGVEGGDGGAEGGEGELGVVEGRELGEEVVVAGKDLVAKLGVEEADGCVELLSSGGRRAGGESGGGEGGGGEGSREEGGEDGVGGDGVKSGCGGGGGVVEGGEELERGRGFLEWRCG
ncbi:hypothetical protein FH972_025257 [Carpinus fangiana]|uniref:Uncharacterized protein n=1 Tax=Carpinus fangiana TaxID=176857 RepID=A0A5N6L142_9ROSI|nr:hypothetical protein FH972_025257 [Carpinus fangiana]